MQGPRSQGRIASRPEVPMEFAAREIEAGFSGLSMGGPCAFARGHGIAPPRHRFGLICRPLHLGLERWQSGRMHRTRNAAYGQPYRGFESLPLRHNLKKVSNPLSSLLQLGSMPPDWYKRVVQIALAMSRPWKHPKTGIYWLRKGVPVDLRAAVGNGCGERVKQVGDRRS
jgi:hypothetical protein